MLHHLYGILDRLPHAAGLPDAGIDDRPVHARRLGGFVVLATALESPPRPGPRALGRHLDVLGAVSAPGPLFPLPYGVTMPAAEVAPWVVARAGTIRAGLSLVRRRVEMRVSVLALHFGEGDPGRLRAVADRVIAAAGYGSCRSHVAGRSGNAAITLAFLVPRAEITTFFARIAPIVARAGDVAVVPSGPWPASTFVPSLDRSVPSLAGPMAVASV
jgi:hypothetical protein